MNKTLLKVLGSSQCPLIVAHEASKVADIKLCRYRDEKANQSLLINATVAPYSPITGNPLKREIQGTIVLKASDIQSLVPFAENKDVGVVYRTTAEIAKVLAGSKEGVFCAVSGMEMSPKVNQKVLAAALAADASEDMSDDSSDMDADSAFTDPSLGDGDGDEGMGFGDGDGDSAPVGDDMSGDPSMDDASSLDDSDFDMGADAGDPSEADAADEDLAFPTDDASTGAMPAGDDSIPAAGGGDDLAGMDDSDSINDGLDSQVTMDDMDSINNMNNSSDTSLASFKIDLLEQTASATDKPRLDVILSGGDDPIYFIMANYSPVAVAKKDLASDGVQKIFLNVARFTQAFKESVGTEGFSSEVIANFGLEPIQIEVKETEALRSKVTAATAEVEADFKSKKERMDSVFRHSLSIASLALTKNLFKDQKDPLRLGLIETLASINVRNPEQVIDRVYEKHGEDHLRTMLQLAYDLSEKSDDTRNELAKFVQEASYQTTKVDESERVISRLTTGNSPKMEETASTPETMTPSAVQNDRVIALRQTMGLTRQRRLG